jgi:PadR family transcriptional regulator, regulatory protein AphA
MTARAQLGTTSCVVLGLLSKRPISGYDVASLATRSIVHFWPISKSQVYAELSRLETDGYIVGTHVEQDNRPDKRRYELTTKGNEALDAWLEADGYAPDRTRSGFLAKFFFAGDMTPDQRLLLLDEYRAEIDTYRLELQAIVEKLEGRADAVYGRSTALYGLLTAEAKIKWADQMIETLSHHPPGGRRRSSS